MNHLLNLSRAARLVGVTRSEIQQQIQQGRLTAFEGMVRQNELLRVYPETEFYDTAVLERLERIKQEAVSKITQQVVLPGVDQLLKDNERLHKELAEARMESLAYQHIVASTQERLIALQEQCTKKEQAMLQSVIHWLWKKTEEQQD